MFDRTIQDPIAFAAVAFAALVAMPAIALMLRLPTEPRGAAPGLLQRLGGSHLLTLWLLFIPLNLVSHALGDSFVLVFGSEAFDGGVVETLTAAGFAGIAALAFAAGLQHARPKWEQAALLAFGALAILALGEEISWGQQLVHFQSPELFAHANLQKETNAHNFVSPRDYDVAYMAVGWSLIGGAIVAFLKPRLFGPFKALADVFAHVRYAAPLAITAGLLMQHEVFEELSEWALAGAVFYVLAAYVARTAPTTLRHRGGRVNA